MSRKATKLYDFALAAGASFDLPVDAGFYKILSSSGDLQITRDGGSSVKPMRAGRGERNVSFTKLTLKDISGAPNSGTILVGDTDFIDDTIVLSSSINVQPEAPAAAIINNFGAMTALQVDTLVAPGTNTNGLIILLAEAASNNAAGFSYSAFLTKTSAPSSVSDGRCVGRMYGASFISGTFVEACKTQNVRIPAGEGVYFIAGAALASSARSLIYKLL